MKAYPRARLIMAGAVLAAVLAAPAVAASDPNDVPPPISSALQSQLDTLVAPSSEVTTAQDQMVALAAQAEGAATAFATAQSDEADALADEAAAQAEAAAATQRAADARAQLGDYAASAYISGGSTAGVSATLTSGTPTEMVARQNTLAAVADNSTDLVRVLREAEAAATAARAAANTAAASAAESAEAARVAAAEAAEASKAAEALLASLVAQELEVQTQEVTAAALRARVAAYAAGAGAGVVDAQGDPIEYLAFGNGQIPPELLSPVVGTGHRLWPAAARGLEGLLAAAAAEGVTISITDSYRGYEAQVELVTVKGLYSQGGLAAAPGTSDHGWGTAVDLALDGDALAWIRANGATYGFVEDVPRESWHWHFLPSA